MCDQTTDGVEALAARALDAEAKVGRVVQLLAVVDQRRMQTAWSHEIRAAIEGVRADHP